SGPAYDSICDGICAAAVSFRRRTAVSNTRTYFRTHTDVSNRLTASSRAFALSSAYRRSSLRSLTTDRVTAGGSFGRTMKPVSPSATTSRTAPTSVATTGKPHAIASIAVVVVPSDRGTDVTTLTSIAA